MSLIINLTIVLIYFIIIIVKICIIIIKLLLSNSFLNLFIILLSLF